MALPPPSPPFTGERGRVRGLNSFIIISYCIEIWKSSKRISSALFHLSLADCPQFMKEKNEEWHPLSIDAKKFLEHIRI
jgi:hypothetical protein